ncbi:hypothetical protein BO82DRAFT_10321 [Aspergillus uvarum CBS 121591]|uniref:Uncharacterized protein n=1 Tax=Aspergillus uvarum CBS 121591 TaxID=1448315 RepID=A0A319CP34_9EURO|nr:hypothetical protein BO82DRAFT_10321 [Aspergillus uvarum CBS 121591]PYH84727.1 hypothetical protein BO82DRAFT_10321 [Aspergillus uvarum CBS 121591]
MTPNDSELYRLLHSNNVVTMPQQPSASQRKPRRFQPELVETSSRSSREVRTKSQPTQAQLDGRRCSDGQYMKQVSREDPMVFYDDREGQDAEPIDAMQTTMCAGSERAAGPHKPTEQRLKVTARVGRHSSIGPTEIEPDRFDAAKHIRLRKFAPQLMETGTRSFRRMNTSHTTLQEGRNALVMGEIPTTVTAVNDAHTHRHVAHESRFSYMNLRRRQETRRHSFRIPDLPAIPSTCSETSDTSDNPSASASPGRMEQDTCADIKTRGSSEDENTEYLSALAAITVEKQLKEQALAAFPNEQDHQPVDHFAIDREEEEFMNNERPTSHVEIPPKYIHRRTSSADLSWELDYMRRHKEEAEMSDRAMARTRGPPFLSPNEFTSLGSRRPARHHDNRVRGRDPEPTKNNATPPMLGEDLIFPQSLSPESTVCEGSNIQHNVTRNRLCVFSGLWYGGPHVNDRSNNGGLWKGTCKTSSSQERQSPRCSIAAPIAQTYTSFTLQPTDASRPTDKNQFLEPSPWILPTTHYNLQQDFHDESLGLELQDGLVTQIYNYLSLGYPCVARYFDHELSRISGISVANLRQDDLKTDAKGHVGVSDSPSIGEDISTRACMRWKALQLYIFDWARERHRVGFSDMDGEHGAWGVCERKGSWAV